MPRVERMLLMSAMLGLGLHSAWAITGCSNSYLSGTYNAQVSNSEIANLINAVNNNGSTTTTTASVTFPGSLIAGGPNVGRYYFDGNGNVIGMQSVTTPAGSASVSGVIGTYSVDTNCNAKISLNGGSRSFYGVITNQGQTVLFLESDSSGMGTTGSFQRSANSCTALPYAQSFGFTFFGASQTAASAGSGTGSGTGSGSGSGTGTTTAAVTFQPLASVGTLQLDGAGNYTMSAWITNNGATTQSSVTGTYTIGPDCSVRLAPSSNSSSSGGSTGGLVTPFVFTVGGTNGNSGQPNTLLQVQSNGSTLAGLIFAQ